MTKESAKALFQKFLTAQATIDEKEQELAESVKARSAILGNIHEVFGTGPFQLKDGRQFSIARREATRAGKLDETRFEIRFRGQPNKVTNLGELLQD